MLKETYIFRPLGPHAGMLRYAEGEWLPDDGNPDLAFIHGTNVIYVALPRYTNILWAWWTTENHKRVWHYQTIDNEPTEAYYWGERDKHPNEVAGRSGMRKCCDLHGCATGQSIELVQPNAYIENRLLCTLSSGEPVVAPANPTCYLCLNEGRGHYINDLLWKRDMLEGEIACCVDDINDYRTKMEWEQSTLEARRAELAELQDLMEREGIKTTQEGI